MKWLDVRYVDDFRCDVFELCAASLDKLFLKDEDSERYWGPVPLPEDVLLQLAKGLSYVHSKGLILNPKPEKAFIWTGTSSHNNGSVYGRVLMKWANCCLSKRTNDEDQQQQGNSSCWMAPERLKWDQDINENKSVESTQTSDVYEEGLVFDYFLSSGKLPGSIDRQAQQETEPMINSKDVVPLCALNLLKSMLSTSPQNRMKAKDVVRKLERLVDEGHLKDNLPGKSVKLNYTLNNILGSGMNGDVYQGFLGIKPVAVKTIKRSDITEDIQSNKREEVLKFLNHPNVVKLLHVEDNEITKTQGRHTLTTPIRVFALELCEASLDKLFLGDEDPKKYRWPNPPPKDVEVFGQIAEGLAYIHGKKLIHRDLKPQNVLIWADNKQVLIKLADFGFCKKVNAGGEASISELKGTKSWIPPEIYHMRNDPDFEDKVSKREFKTKVMSDIFSEGLVFGYYLLKGKHPYGPDILKNMYIDYNPVKLNKDMGKSTTRELKKMLSLIGEMLRKDPERRPTSQQVVVKIIRAQDVTTREVLRLDRLGILGRGIFATVFAGKFQNLDVAVKRKMRFNKVKEIDAMKHLGNQHPNIVKLLYYEEDDVFRTVCGFTGSIVLTTWTSTQIQRAYRLPHLFMVLSQVASGLQYIHSKGLMHGNPSPENLLISIESTCNNEVTIKWSGFGLSRFVNDNGTFTAHKHNSPVGITRSWIAPEKFKCIVSLMEESKDQYELNGFKSDIFSEGCIFAYLLLEGQHPFGSSKEILSNITDNNPINLKEIQRSLAYDLIQNMLDPNPEVRFTADKVLEEVESIIKKSKEMETKFLRSCGKGTINISAIKTLIQNGIDINCKNKNDWNVLYVLGCHNSKVECMTDVIRLLIQNGIDLNHKPLKEKNIVLFFCSFYRKRNLMTILKLFIQSGYKLTTEDLTEENVNEASITNIVPESIN